MWKKKSLKFKRSTTLLCSAVYTRCVCCPRIVTFHRRSCRRGSWEIVRIRLGIRQRNTGQKRNRRGIAATARPLTPSVNYYIITNCTGSRPSTCSRMSIGGAAKSLVSEPHAAFPQFFKFPQSAIPTSFEDGRSHADGFVPIEIRFVVWTAD